MVLEANGDGNSNGDGSSKSNVVGSGKMFYVNASEGGCKLSLGKI